jgi:hypothetical protein
MILTKNKLNNYSLTLIKYTMKNLRLLVPIITICISCGVSNKATITTSDANIKKTKNTITVPIKTVETIANDPIVYENGIFILMKGQTRVPKDSYVTTESRDSLINQYWDFAGEKKYFLITIDELEDLYKSSPSGKVMIKVTNIDDKKRVKAEWLPYDKDLIQKSLTMTPNYYFVMEKRFFDDTTPDPTKPGGMRYAFEINKPMEMPAKAICARLGRNKDQFYIMANATYIYFLTNTGGTGAPEPPGSGATFPPTGN